MLLREDGADVIAIPQPSHAWLSGQLARAWGKAPFAPPSPFEDVCLAASQHDIGWHSWELRPALDQDTGLPQEFFRVPAPVHVALWRDGVNRACAFGRYPALLVALHAVTIYTRYFDFAKASPEDQATARAFLAEEQRFAAELAVSLRADPATARDASAQNIEHNRLLIATLDFMSLAICRGFEGVVIIPGVPLAEGATTQLKLHTLDGKRDVATITPWPFREARVALHAEGKRLTGRYRHQEELSAALDAAKSVLLTFLLCGT